MEDVLNDKKAEEIEDTRKELMELTETHSKPHTLTTFDGGFQTLVN